MEENAQIKKSTEVANNKPQQKPSTTPKKSNKSLWIILSVIAGVFVLGFIGILVAGWLLISGATKDITKTSDVVVTAVINNSPEDIFNVATSAFTDSTSEEEVTAILDRVSPLLADGTFKVTSTKVNKSSGGNETAIVDYKIKTDNKTYYMQVTLIKDGDTWAMINFQTSENPITTD